MTIFVPSPMPVELFPSHSHSQFYALFPFPFFRHLYSHSLQFPFPLPGITIFRILESRLQPRNGYIQRHALKTTISKLITYTKNIVNYHSQSLPTIMISQSIVSNYVRCFFISHCMLKPEDQAILLSLRVSDPAVTCIMHQNMPFSDETYSFFSEKLSPLPEMFGVFPRPFQHPKPENKITRL